MTDLEKNFTNKESEFLASAQQTQRAQITAEQLMTNLVDRCRHFTASIDLTLLTTDWAVLHKRVMRGNFSGEEEGSIL